MTKTPSLPCSREIQRRPQRTSIRSMTAWIRPSAITGAGMYCRPALRHHRHFLLDYFEARGLKHPASTWAQDNYRGVNRMLGDNAGQQITLTDGWVQDRWALTPRVTLTLGGRISGHSLYEINAVPKAGLVYRATEKLICALLTATAFVLRTWVSSITGSRIPQTFIRSSAILTCVRKRRRVCKLEPAGARRGGART